MGNYNPGLRHLSRGAGFALAGLSHSLNGIAELPFDLELPQLPPPPPSVPSTAPLPPAGSTAPPASSAPSNRFDWNSIISQGFDFAKIFAPRGTVIRTPQGTIVRQSDPNQAPVNYGLSQSDTNINAGAGVGLTSTSGISTGAIIAIGAGALVLLLVFRGGGRR